MKNKNTFKRSALIFFATFSIIFALPAGGSARAQVTIDRGDYPVRISAPSIGLNAPIQGVGTTAAGAMAVPPGSTNNVGWYKYGTKPGENGTAVLDAHVFAAFKNLSRVKVGGDIYITMRSGKRLHFVVNSKQTYALGSLSPYTLFTPTRSQQLNLITCAGQLTADHSTYDHRLIVSAKLV